ncbi:MAG: hypothetical protein CVU33_13970 [Betaproteobacteria bacterium HGW-Betaproteobacteria-6]|nr:MAG: hypothetical protein CVU33_13970 [Betaproteobacteria bacterium HGW-Betaproteobacteria-6]
MTTQFLHKKKESSLWYYRRRFPQDVARVVGKSVHMQSLQTSIKRDAERMARMVAVQFDAICEKARQDHKFQQEIKQAELVTAHGAEAERVDSAASAAIADTPRSADSVLARVPELIRLAATRVVEEQQRDPKGWLDTIRRWKDYYSCALTAPMPSPGPQTAIEAQACLNGIELAIQGQPLPSEPVKESTASQRTIAALSGTDSCAETWAALCDRALREYKHKVSPPRYRLAVSKLPEIKGAGCTELEIQEGLRGWCNARLLEVQPRTVKGQLDCMVSALRCVLPKLTAPVLRELQGVMQPRVGDRQSMPIQEIRAAVHAFKSRPVPTKVRKDFGGGASQFDAIAVEVLAVLGMRPSELIKARPNALVTQEDVFGKQGLFLRLVDGKNKASEREIPLSDGTREVLPVQQLREMLEWQEKNTRSIAGAVTSLGTRFKAMTSGYTLYQMRHSWKDLAVHAGVDSELRERLMGHKLPGVAATYGSGIPLEKGLDALMLVRAAIGL